MGTKAFSTGFSRLVLFSIGDGAKTEGEVSKALAKYGYADVSRGSVYNVLVRQSTVGLIRRRDDGRYEVTNYGAKRIEYLNDHGISIKSPQGRVVKSESEDKK